MRALWVDELILQQRVKPGSLICKSMRVCEYLCLRHSSAIVSLTKSAIDYLNHCYPDILSEKLLKVIPTCVDTTRFTPHSSKVQKPIIFGTVGTVLSSWFRLDLLRQFYLTAFSLDNSIYFEVITKDDPERIKSLLQLPDTLFDRISFRSALPTHVPKLLERHSCQVMFFQPGTSKLGSCPTRLGEALASGQPVLINSGIGDCDDIIRSNHAGIVLAEPDDMKLAVMRLFALMDLPDTAFNCRSTALHFFSLSNGISSYDNLYNHIFSSSTPL